MCKDDPILFNDIILGRDPYWARQREICRAVAQYRNTIVPTGNAVGKTFCAAGIALWFLYTHIDSLVVITAPSQNLIGTVFFKEIRKAHANSLIPLGGEITISQNTSPQLLTLNDYGWQAIGLATRGIERLSGQHRGDLLIIVDEASGVMSEIFEGLASLNPSKMLAIGNPLKAEGEFRDLADRAKREKSLDIRDSEKTVLIKIASTESPDIQLDRSPRGLADAGFLAEAKRKYGEDSLWYRSHILAEFPTVSQDVLIPTSWLDFAAAAPRLNVPPGHVTAGPIRLGCDLGEGVGRDLSAIVVRDDLSILEVVAGKAMGLSEAAKTIADLASKWHIQHHHITYDRLGVGKDMPNHLAKHRINATPYFGNGTPRNTREYPNLRSEAAWNLRRRLNPEFAPDPRYPSLVRPPFSIPPTTWWSRLREELEALSYDLVGSMSRLIPKESLMTKLGRSPDISDALIQTFAFP